MLLACSNRKQCWPVNLRSFSFQFVYSVEFMSSFQLSSVDYRVGRLDIS